METSQPAVQPPDLQPAPSPHPQDAAAPSVAETATTPPLSRTTTDQKAEPSSDVSQLHPLLADFDAIEQDPKSIFPYKWIIYGGNHGETLTKVLRPRGFTRVH